MDAIVCLVALGVTVVTDAGICVSDVIDADMAEVLVCDGVDCVTGVNFMDCIGMAVDAVAKDA